ncbi:MAG TPA: MlaD family protein [Solirubrobacteraceae bacterium]|jgi:ABC-type transporter Mla subunit MlaD|nr:MlaD family protein [Solirubrobacteraceae bacterium]
MRRILLSGSILLAVAAFVFVTTGATGGKSHVTSYKIDFDNAFGLTTGADFKVSGIPAGSISSIDLNQKTLQAVVTVSVTQPGLAAFHSNATCDSQPQSLIGEYFVSCQPGTSGPRLKSGATIPVTHTQSTIPADLILNILRMPEQQGLRLLIDSLGAGVAARSTSLQAALDRAVPALTQTDNLLNLLANDSHTLQSLTASSDQVVTSLANNTGAITRFIQYANKAATNTADQKVAFKQTLADLPGFLAQLRPAMQRLDQATTTNTPVVENLHAAASQLDTLFTNLPGFAHSALPATRALGQASVTGKAALTAAKPTVAELERFAKPTPELAKNLSIVLPALDTQKNATEPNPRSPGGKGYSGLEAVLQFVFNLAGSTSYYGPYGHELAVDAFANQQCSPYANPTSVAQNLASDPSATRACYSWLGRNQPGVNETDPSAPSSCVPDPGGAPPGRRGPSTSAKKCSPLSSGSGSPLPLAKKSSSKSSSSGSSSATKKVTSTVNQIVKQLQSGGNKVKKKLKKTTSSLKGLLNSATGGSSSGTTSQAQQLLNYLLSP